MTISVLDVEAMLTYTQELINRFGEEEVADDALEQANELADAIFSLWCKIDSNIWFDDLEDFETD